ncbi:PQQ-binding-like beta-propeller repeat protein [Halarchaeum sp. P4]|uniref:outer membrane protein assembly factor BamB family protein n=1 Tax=Halarchaeum sp. P4 TaxID=3421639 RepID=UPI003EBFF560
MTRDGERGIGPRTTRRGLLAALGASGASALAGCSGMFGESEETEPVTVDIDPSRDVGTPGWPVGHGDAGNTNAFPKGAGVGDSLALDWTVTLGGNAAAIPPVVRDDYAVTSNGWHQAYGMRTDGTVAWQNQYPNGVTTVPPAFVGDVVVLVADGDLVALDPTDGSQVWTASLPGADTFAWLNGADDTVVAATNLGVAAIDAGDGTRRWYYQTGRETQSPPALADGVVYAGSEDTYVYALDGASGAVRWRVKTEARVGSLAVAEGRVYAATEDGVLYGLDAASGTERWTATLDGAPFTLAVTGGQLFVGVDADRRTDHLRAVDADDGTLGWRTPAFSGSSLAAGVDALYAPVERDDEYGETLGVLDPTTGAVRAHLQTPDRTRVYRGPAVADGGLYAAGLGRGGVLTAKVTSGN